METKYVSRYIPVNAEKLEVIKAYQEELEKALGFKVSLSDAIVHAIKRVTKEDNV